MEASNIVLWLCTFLYHWTFRKYTLNPIISLVSSTLSPEKYLSIWENFRYGKHHELVLVKAGCALAAAASVGVFSWPSAVDTVWLAQTFWYWALTLAIFGLIMAEQHSSLLNSTTATIPHPTSNTNIGVQDTSRLFMHARKTSRKINWNMVYIWQAPLMFMSWSWFSFFLGLTFHVSRPFFPQPQRDRDDKRIALSFLTFVAISLTNFGWCCAWLYINAPTARKDLHVDDPEEVPCNCGGGSKSNINVAQVEVVPIEDEMPYIQSRKETC
ncbi:hypothetical protein BKA66DRAFT_66712 [Pyrenochaeta sp. MPI-SDFR-AT-0127]|nr:hypothetical protein BKA66DRAFT_66712 [Pyrenochaeta sp. MPI-SDFR-AT-0127]